MLDHIQTSYDTDNNQLQGSIQQGIIGGIVGMLFCSLILLLCFWFEIRLGILLQLFVSLVVGWFYRLFHGQRSKTVAYAIVSVCTILVYFFWMLAFVLFSANISLVQLISMDKEELWQIIMKLLPLCVGLGLVGFFLARRPLLIYADWKKAPWHIAYSYAGGVLYNLLPKKLPLQALPTSFIVQGRFIPSTRIIVKDNSFCQKSCFRKDQKFSVNDIAGVVLGPSSGCNVIYDKNYQVLAKFAGSMEHADLLLAWLFQRNIPMDNAPTEWCTLDEVPDTKSFKIPKQHFTLQFKRSTQMGFKVLGCFLLLIGIVLFLVIDFFALTKIKQWLVAVFELVILVIGVVYLHIKKTYQVEIDGERIRKVSWLGCVIEFSVKEVSLVSNRMGWIILYDKDFKTLVKLDSYLENLDMLKEYLAFYGIRC